jgi:large subunit ribosomal protein L20
MARVKGGKTSNKRRKNILALTKGYRHGRKSKKRQAKEAIFHAGKYAFAHRRDKKNDFRRLWNVRIGAGLGAIEGGMTYSKFIGALNKKGIRVNRKMLAELAEKSPRSFEAIVNEIK